MRLFIRHAIALLLFSFVCKIVLQAREEDGNSGVPKALLLSTLDPQQPIPSRKIDPKPIITAISRN